MAWLAQAGRRRCRAASSSLALSPHFFKLGKVFLLPEVQQSVGGFATIAAKWPGDELKIHLLPTEYDNLYHN
jgi:hypothetical protein